MCLSDASVFIPVLSLDAALRAAQPRWLSTARARVRYEMRAHLSMVSLRSTKKARKQSCSGLATHVAGILTLPPIHDAQ
jgi:hypothetical protein